MARGADWVEVFRTPDQIEAEFIKGLLATAEIPVVVEAKGLKTMTPILGHAATGQLVLKVPPDMERLARELIAAPPMEEEGPEA